MPDTDMTPIFKCFTVMVIRFYLFFGRLIFQDDLFAHQLQQFLVYRKRWRRLGNIFKRTTVPLYHVSVQWHFQYASQPRSETRLLYLVLRR
jgi:hypothetical protein